MNRLLDTLEDKVADRTARLAQTVTALERRLAESEALMPWTRPSAPRFTGRGAHRDRGRSPCG